MDYINRLTPYEWCLKLNIRPLDLKEDEVDYFHTVEIYRDAFDEFLKSHRFKPNSTPRKAEKYLELRMYGFVPYNISDIQKGIQFGHAVVQYSRQHEGEMYNRFADEWKTFIILNGGTSNSGTKVRHGFRDIEYSGSLQNIMIDLYNNEIDYSVFEEPDLNNMLSAIVFLVDERVFNKEVYPDFKSHPYPWLETRGRNAKPTDDEMKLWEETNNKNYEAWVEKIGGPKNVFLRDLLRDKRLA